MAAERPQESGPAGGGAESLEALFVALEGPLLGYALRWLKDTDMAEDTVQEAFLRLQEQGPAVREPRSWLYRTIHNLALNHLRSLARVVSLTAAAPSGEPMADELADERPLPDEELARVEAAGLVRLGLTGLDPRSREVVRLKFEEELSYREISARTGLGVGHVGYLLHHALKTLAADLTKAGLLP